MGRTKAARNTLNWFLLTKSLCNNYEVCSLLHIQYRKGFSCWRSLCVLHYEVGLGVCLFFCSLRCGSSSCRHFQRKIFQVWGDEVFTFLDGALGPSTFSGRVGKRGCWWVGWLEEKQGRQIGKGWNMLKGIERKSDGWWSMNDFVFLQTCDQQFDSLVMWMHEIFHPKAKIIILCTR